MRPAWLSLLLPAAVACSGSGGGPGGGPDGGTGSGQPPGATVTVPVSVPASMRSAPFDVPRSLTVPAGFAVAVYARVPGARFIAVTPEGNLLVSNPGAGKVSLVRPGTAGGDAAVSDWVTGLRKPHDLVFHSIGGTPWLYLSESNGVRRYAWAGATTAPGSEVVVTGLPDSSTP
ncbi:MAG TPA: sugar dehydrogenase, partial [Myxococcaceae bacterium]|nr:sugar dehydrogenase [Myxococcaceae bacterium]